LIMLRISMALGKNNRPFCFLIQIHPLMKDKVRLNHGQSVF
jgi:hypothetical protein